MTTIRIPHSVAIIAPDRLAALVTHAVVAPTRDDVPDTSSTRLGGAWLLWFEARRASEPAPLPDRRGGPLAITVDVHARTSPSENIR